MRMAAIGWDSFKLCETNYLQQTESDEDFDWGCCWTIAVLTAATAIVLQDLPRVQLSADCCSVADISLPVVTILAKIVSDVPTGVAGLHCVAPVWIAGGWSWRERIITSTAAAVTSTWKSIRFIEFLQLSMPEPALVAFLLGKDTIKREETNTCQLLSELLLNSLLKADDLICIKLRSPLL